MQAISGCVLQFIVALFFIWFVMVHPEIVNGLISAMSRVFDLIILLLTQIINAIQ